MLRPYQLDINDEVIRHIRAKRRRILVRSETGSGKTVLASHFLKNAYLKGNAAMFNVHRVELITQSALTFMKNDFPFGVIAPAFREEYDKLIQIASIMTISRRMQKMKHRPKVIIWDECHHIAADNWSRIFHHFPDAVHIGLTATPMRLDGKGLDDYFEVMVEGPSMSDLMADGYLTRYKLISTPIDINVDGIAKRMGDYVMTDLASITNTPAISGNCVKQWEKHALGMKTLIFAVNVSHSQEITQYFIDAGHRASHIDGGADKTLRTNVITDFKESLIDLMSNVNLFSEGFDVPLTQAIIKLKKSMSLAYDRQVSGRVLRPVYHERYSFKDLLSRECRLQAIADSVKPVGIILDQAKNWQRHGLPDDEIKWTLQGKKKGDEERRISSKECPKCYFVGSGFAKKCSNCGHEFVAADREVNLEMSDENLVELDIQRIKEDNRRKQMVAKTEPELIELAKSRGSTERNAKIWAKYVLKSRTQKEKRKQDGQRGR